MKPKQILVLMALISWSGLGVAQTSDTAVAAARDLGNEGIDLYEKGEYETACDRLGRAYQVIRVPTLGLWYARSLAKTGKLVEAAERFREVARMPAQPGEAEVIQQAREDAQREGDELKPRIPSVEVKIDGATVQQVQITLGGKPLEAVLIGVPVPMNPGKVAVQGRRGTEQVEASITLAEGARESVTLQFAKAAPAEAPPAGPPPVAPPTPPPASPPAAEPPADQGVSSGGFPQKTLAYVAFGVGGAGLITSTVTFFLAKGKQKDLQDACQPNGDCPTRYDGDISSFETMQTVSLVTLIVGGVGAAAGGVLLLTAPSDAPTQAHVSPYLGLGTAGVKGCF